MVLSQQEVLEQKAADVGAQSFRRITVRCDAKIARVEPVFAFEEILQYGDVQFFLASEVIVHGCDVGFRQIANFPDGGFFLPTFRKHLPGC